ncbi:MULTISPECIES: magnesium-translocating P-type ATPase [unclassified Comamonas]|uniref:Magnesium-transporting ATPase, P-type 1 n=1 Tax=Comamonas squillarum TaxID=2977320 RepID=A0ABY6A0F8_9BURK|nr:MULTISPECIES: magnesium-translocating P-type ATPase [unclassified Comamonas]PWB15788.1 magnesium-translocating P-type ATPase [Comamonas sp. JNW]UXC18452.1 magnesium-translocating P-type ATPase [Comamonas sp. PR12]
MLNLLKNGFVNFLRSRHWGVHFRRLPMLEQLAHTPVDTGISKAMGERLRDAAHAPEQALLHSLNTSRQGLDDAQVQQARAQAGWNTIAQDQAMTRTEHLWLCFRTPFNLLLTVLAAVSWLTGDTKATVVIGSMVALATGLRFWQEGRANKAAAGLQAMVSNTAAVLRRTAQDQEGRELDAPPSRLSALQAVRELPVRELVPGDIIQLAAGDMVPADCRLLSAKDLFLAQSAMTGESMPVEKFAQLPDGAQHNPVELCNLVFMGTNVVSGAGLAVVLTTGNHSYLGALAGKVSAMDRSPTAFQMGVNKVSWVLIRFMLVMVPLVLLINGWTKGDWTEALLFALSVAVGLTPEMLPMIVTATLAKGAVFLSRKKVIVKHLDAIQNFGAMDVLCTDKTGTLTEDRISVERHLDAWGDVSHYVLDMAYLNSYYQTGLKSLLDVAVLAHAERAPLVDAYAKVDEVPFDFVRRRMSVVVSDSAGIGKIITKGAVEEILQVSSMVQAAGGVLDLDAGLRKRIVATAEALNAQGLRVVAVATRETQAGQSNFGVADEAGMVLCGFLAFIDPPKESAAPALQALARHGVQTKVLTGDNAAVTAKVCEQVGINAQHIVLGGDIEQMDDQRLAQVVEEAHIFAKLSPAHKERIVRMLKANGHVVGFMGDGINDAAALRTADIGISVDTAVDVAKEAADIILLDKSLMVLDQGVQEGRRTFANMLKYIKMTASSNFGNVFSVLIASAFIPFLPMLPMQLLVQNLVYDFSQSAIPFDHVDPELLTQPQRWNPADVGRFMLFFGPISSIFDITTFVVMWKVFGANTPERQALFQSGWFVVGLLTQSLIVHMIRTMRIPFIQSRAAWPVGLMTLVVVAIGIYLPMGALAPYFKLEPLPGLYFVFLVAVLLAYMGLTQVMKKWYIRRYGWQ